MPPDLNLLLGEVRDLVVAFKAGDEDSFEAFRKLLNRLLGLTVLAAGGAVRLWSGPRPDAKVIGGWTDATDPLPLNDGRYLRLTVSLFREPFESGHRLKVSKSSYQYQTDHEGGDWVFRYDYLRDPEDRYPAAHLQIRAELESNVLPSGKPLERIHFPTERVSVEAVIRLLVEGFNVPCNEAPEIWRPVLAASEKAFQEIAHRPPSGPSE